MFALENKSTETELIHVFFILFRFYQVIGDAIAIAIEPSFSGHNNTD